MVTHTGAPLRADQFRPLNRPQPIDVSTNDRGIPALVRERGKVWRIERVIDRWRIDDEWWRTPICRLYYMTQWQGGIVHIIYKELVQDRWYRQRDLR